MTPDAITTVFADCFAAPTGHAYDRARLVRGGDEPQFLPAVWPRRTAEVVYARGLPQSCLHEAAHWLHAGSERRLLADYGYWYLPDGRDVADQERFERLEAEVQALEWILSDAAGITFTISCDNLVRPDPSDAFRAAIATAVRRRLEAGLGRRAHQLTAALCQASGRPWPTVTGLAATAWAPVPCASVMAAHGDRPC